MRKVLFAAVAGLLLGTTACSSPPETGTVYKRPYAPLSYWYSTDCGMYVPVTKTRVVSDGKTSRTETYTETQCVMYVQNAHEVPPSWELCLQADDDPKHKGCRKVPESTWNQYQVGDHYPNHRND